MAYPETIPVFTDLVNDVDDVLAEHQNDPNDVITSIATMLGAIGASQSYSLDMLDYLANKQAPILTKASASTLKVAIGGAVLKNAAQSKKFLKRTVADITVTAANIDTGSMAAGYYYVYLIGDAAATTFTVAFSTSATNPNVAAGLIYELIGWFYNESGGSLDVTNNQVGNIKRNGRDVPNVIKMIGVTDIDNGGSTSLADIAGLTGYFYSSGRPVTIMLDAPVKINNAVGSLAIDVDGATVKLKSGAGAASSSFVVPFTLITLQSLSAGVHTIKARWKSDGTTIYQIGTTEERTLIIQEN